MDWALEQDHENSKDGKIMLYSSSTEQYFDSSWQSVERIPIVLLLLQEELHQLETPSALSKTGPPRLAELQQKLIAYRALHQHWIQADLNPRQTEWLSKIQFYLQALEQRVRSLSPSSVLNHFPPITQEKSVLMSDHLVTDNQEAGG
jgi:hypothetical protein